ncbi:hypothetical protein MSAN_00978200 [Mycena sanguinolenta]|uniref:JmjC domain-containing protein n=1 Tax=Mycena sanguinolenta TaxID=230812 RepID=A0A8H7DCK9_9AGAR|nr:hypothetical protein MSAN_00978200 [Mycena sanguinolenta]
MASSSSSDHAASTAFNSLLFSAPWPWLHKFTRNESFDSAAAAEIVALHFEKSPECLKNFMEAVAHCNEWLVRLVDPLNVEAVSEKRGVVQWGWGVEMYTPLSNRVRSIIGLIVPPLIVADTLLHISNSNPVPPVARAARRIDVSLSQCIVSILKPEANGPLYSFVLIAATREMSPISHRRRLPVSHQKKRTYWISGVDFNSATPLLTVIRNLTHVSLVLSLYLLGDVKLSCDGREGHLLQTAQTLGVSLTAAEAKAAVANTDISLMMAPLLVAMAHSPLVLLCQTGYASSQFSSRVALLDTWRALGNEHRVDPTDPLSILEATLWRLLFRLALREITELQLLHYFYEDEFVRQTLELLSQNAPVQKGYGLGYAGDSSVDTTDLIDLTEETQAEVEVDTEAIQIGPLVSNEDKAADQPPPRKKRKTDSSIAASAPDSNSAGLPPRAPPGSGATSRPKKPLKAPKKSSACVEIEDEEDEDDIVPPASYNDLRTLAVLDGWKLPLLREVESLLQTAQKPERVLDPTLLYDLASDDFTVDIDYWVFAPAPDDPSQPLVATSHKYKYRPFHDTRSEASFLTNIVKSQRFKPCKASNRMLPLHVHPDAQKFRHTGPAISDEGQPLLPDVIPSDEQSIVFVVHEDVWKSMTARQHQEVLRTRAVLVVHRHPYLHDGRLLKFDEDGLSAFTHIDRLAFIQDLGGRRDGKTIELQVGRPRDLLACSKARKEWEAERSQAVSSAAAVTPSGAKQTPGSLEQETDSRRATTATCDDDPLQAAATSDNEPVQSQRLNLLGNTLQSTSLNMLSGWIDLATHEFACTWLEHLSEVPPFVFPWSEVTWNITANADAVTWIHGDVLFTIIDLPIGEKLWYMASRRSDLPSDDFRGIMRSRHAFDTFNGWTDMTSVWNFEQVHLSPYTTLYMPATFPHAVISLNDCMGVGRHGIPISNLSHCVYTTLHNTVVSKSTTNADHEPARRFLIRIFIFIVLAFVKPRNGAGGRGRSEGGLSARTREHLPDLATNDGIVDILALRSFVVLSLALNGSGYQYSVDKDNGDLLPLETEAARELSLAWKLAHDLVEFVSHVFIFEKIASPPPATSEMRRPTSFLEAANFSLVTMAVSMQRYIHHADKKNLPKRFDAVSFQKQAERMLVLFELHKGLSASERDAQLFANPDSNYRGSEVSPSTEFTRYVADRTRSFAMLQPWDSAILPFSLIPVPRPS